MKKTPPSMDAWLREAKEHESAPKIGMYLTHNGIVRQTAKAKVRYGAEDTREVTGMIFSYDQFSSTTTSWLIEYIKPGNGTRYELLRNYYDEETYMYYDLYFKPVPTAPVDLVIPGTVYGLSVEGIYNSVSFEFFSMKK